MKKFLTVLFVFVIQQYKSQNIRIIDKITRQTIPGVTAFSENRINVSISNSKGEIKFSEFINSDTISFTLIGYEKLTLSVTQIKNNNYRVELMEAKISLNEVVVSANRWEESNLENPNRINKIKKREIEFQNPQTTADVLEAGGYAYIQKSQMAGGSPSLRGFATNRVLLVIDGVRMNNAIFRSGNLQNVISIDANALENAEILFGPGAVMYGSDAIGGVMDFHTIKPKFADSAGKYIFTGAAFGRFSSANTEKTGHVDFNIGSKNWSAVTSITYADYDDLRTGTQGNAFYMRPSYAQTINGRDSTLINSDSTLQIASGFSQINFMQKVQAKPNKFLNLTYDLHYSATSDAPRYDRLTLDANNDKVLDNAVWYYGPQKWVMNRIGITSTQKNVLFDQLRFVMASQNTEESRHDRRFNSKQFRHQTEKVQAYSVNVDLDKKINSKLSLFYGFEAIHNLISSEAYRKHIVTEVVTPSTTRYPNASTWQAYGAYANVKYKFHPKLIFNAGARYSYFAIKADFDTTLFPFPFISANISNGAVNGNAGLVFSPANSFQIYLNAASGFRAPNMDDLGKVFESQPGFVVVPNINLKPEYAYNAELGFAKAFKNIFKIDAAAYYTILQNALARRDFKYNGSDSILYDGQMSKVLAIQNITQAYVYGFQSGFEINFGYGFGLKTTFNYQKGEEQSEDSLKYYPKPHVAPLFGRTSLNFSVKRFKFDAYMQYNGKMDFENLPLVDRIDNSIYAKTANGLPYVPAWYTINFKAAWFINKNFNLNVGIENITNQLYRTYASGISAPGRNFIVSARFKF